MRVLRACVRACLYVCVRAYMHACVYVCVCARAYVCVCANAYSCVHMCVRAHVCRSLYQHVCACVSGCLRISRMSVYNYCGRIRDEIYQLNWENFYCKDCLFLVCVCVRWLSPQFCYYRITIGIRLTLHTCNALYSLTT